MRWRPAELSGLAAPLLALGCAVVALVLVAADAPWWWASIVGAVAWCAVISITLADWRRSETTIAVSHPSVVARATLLFAIGIAAGHMHHRLWLFWACIGLLVVGMTIEPVLVQLAPESGVANLPSVRPLLSDRVLRIASVESVIVLAAGVALDLAKSAVWWWVGLALAQLCVTTVLALIVLRARRRRERHAKAVSRALAEYGPVFAVYTGRRSGGVYQVAMWLPYLERLRQPYVIVTRHASAVAALAELTDAPVVACVKWGDLDRVVVPSLRVALYVNSLGDNADFLTHRELRHVYLGHGESDKALSVHPMHAAYDLVLVAGQAAIDRYRRAGLQIPAERLVIVGRPQVSDIHSGTPRAGEQPTVLYAPTWLGYNTASSYSSLREGGQVVQQLLDHGCRVIFRPHPFSLERERERGMVRAVVSRLAADAEASGRQHLFGSTVDEASFADAANESQMMVCDVSSVLTDYLHAGKPVAVIDALGALAKQPELHPDTQAAYVVAADLHNLSTVLEDMLAEDSLRSQRMAYRDYVLSHSVADPGERFVTVLRQIAGVDGDTKGPACSVGNQKSAPR